MSTAIFPKMPGLTYSIMRSPIGGRTLTQESISGKEFRLATWAKGSNRHNITLDFSLLQSRYAYPSAVQVPVASSVVVQATNLANDFDALRGFFLEMQGSLTEFLLDPMDEDPAVQTNFGVGDGTSTVFQLVRNIGGHSEIIQNVNGTPILPTGSWTSSTGYSSGNIVIPSNIQCYLQAGHPPGYYQFTGWPYYFTCSSGGTSDGVEPYWRTLQMVGQTITPVPESEMS